MAAGVDGGGEVVDPVAGDLGEDRCDDGGEVKEAFSGHVLDKGRCRCSGVGMRYLSLCR